MRYLDRLSSVMIPDFVGNIMKTVLVTGASGYIGSHVVSVALERGYHVLTASRKPETLDPRAINIASDFSDISANSFTANMKPDVCIHLAWTDGFVHNSRAHIENLPRHVNFVSSLIDADVKHFAGLGTMHEVGYWEGAIDELTPGQPRSLYGVAKVALRDAARLELAGAKGVFQWLRAYYIFGDDNRSKSLFSKILSHEHAGKRTFPLTSGNNLYDFIHVRDLARQILTASTQTEVDGIIECCSGEPVSLRSKVEEFMSKNALKIVPEYGAYPDRPYDSPGVWGNADKIRKIMLR
jgi:nucleoside-diphosphate-sugar epimerase